MIKYVQTEVVFSEIPDEITLAINISNCPHRCPGCHSAYLQQNVGEALTLDVLENLIKENNGITCVAFMGDGGDFNEIFLLGVFVKNEGLKVALYTGAEDVPTRFWEEFDYIKVGPYIEKLGPLNKETTNQRLYKHHGEDVRTFETVNGVLRSHWADITYKFWKKDM